MNDFDFFFVSSNINIYKHLDVEIEVIQSDKIDDQK